MFVVIRGAFGSSDRKVPEGSGSSRDVIVWLPVGRPGGPEGHGNFIGAAVTITTNMAAYTDHYKCPNCEFWYEDINLVMNHVQTCNNY